MEFVTAVEKKKLRKVYLEMATLSLLTVNLFQNRYGSGH